MKRQLQKVNKIILHNSTCCDPSCLHFSEVNEVVVQGRPLDKVGSHCIPEKKPFLGEYLNYTSVAIAGDNPKILGRLIVSICSSLGLPISRETVLAHKDVSNTNCGFPLIEEVYFELEV